ncbi:MAG: hypothetical protein NTZ27_04205 [Ignavibacteriales bacterium]|nr:hypothetical protein [Ignavibacteriales bacterium]
MFNKKFFFVLFVLTISSFVSAQTIRHGGFDEEMAPWHKKAVMTCGMLKNMDSFDQQKFIKNLDELEAELKVLSEKYLNNPPAEYAKDPQWKTYLEDLKDNTDVIRERIEKKEYRLAQKYCPFYCMTFGKMHRNNGKTDLTDVMFSWRAEIKNAMDMFVAGNVVGAINHLEMVDRMTGKVKSYQQKKNDAKFNELFIPLGESEKAWKEGITNNNAEKAKTNFDKFMNEFGKPYMYTL